jgi:ergothioneine biosynthesis protein EgtB
VLTDIKHALFQNPMHPAYRASGSLPRASAPAQRFVSFDGGLVEIGAPDGGFAFDNERPRHRVWVDPFSIGSRLVTNAEYAAFVRDGGYRRPDLWLSEGFRLIHDEKIEAPLYWLGDERAFTLSGVDALRPEDPVCHLSFFEADAFARWAGARLPTEAEWEVASSPLAVRGNLLENATLRPRPASIEGLDQIFGDTWEWTQSAYGPYPGFRALGGALGEYNAKFMSNQMVLRGGSCFSAQPHVRSSYRNFFHPATRWQMTGIRLAR